MAAETSLDITQPQMLIDFADGSNTPWKHAVGLLKLEEGSRWAILDYQGVVRGFDLSQSPIIAWGRNMPVP